MGGRESALQPSPQTPLSRLSPSDSCPWRRIRVGIISSSCSNMQCLVLLSTAKIQTIFRNGFILLGFCWCSRLDITCQCILVKKCLYVRHANIVQEVKTCYKIKISYRESKSCFYVFSASKPPLPTIKDPHIALIAPLLQSKSVTIARQYLRYWVVIMPIVTVSIILTMVDLGTKYENYKWNVLRRKKPPK